MYQVLIIYLIKETAPPGNLPVIAYLFNIHFQNLISHHGPG